jgi:hypothetical protein
VIIEFGSRLCRIEDTSFSGCAALRCVHIPTSIKILGLNWPRFRVIPFESSPLEGWLDHVPFLNPIFRLQSEVASDDFCEGYDQFLTDIANDNWVSSCSHHKPAPKLGDPNWSAWVVFRTIVRESNWWICLAGRLPLRVSAIWLQWLISLPTIVESHERAVGKSCQWSPCAFTLDEFTSRHSGKYPHDTVISCNDSATTQLNPDTWPPLNSQEHQTREV